MVDHGNGNGPEQETEEIEIQFVDEDGQPRVDTTEDHGLQLVGAAPGGEEEESSEPPAARAENVDRLKEELENFRELYLRKLAEFDNFRKRVERERDEVRTNAAADVVRELVPVMDNFDRALAHAEADPESLRQGVEMIARQLWDTLARQGLEVVDPLGRPFDPEFHEAVQRVEDPSHEPGTVVQVLGKGYLFRGRLVRPAMVAVAVEPRARQPEEQRPEEGEVGS